MTNKELKAQIEALEARLGDSPKSTKSGYFIVKAKYKGKTNLTLRHADNGMRWIGASAVCHVLAACEQLGTAKVMELMASTVPDADKVATEDETLLG